VLGALYVVVNVYALYDDIPPSFMVSIVFSEIYFVLSNYVLNLRFRELYKTIIDNENLLKQNRKLMEAFPDGVVVEDLNGDGNLIITDFGSFAATDLNKNGGDDPELGVTVFATINYSSGRVTFARTTLVSWTRAGVGAQRVKGRVVHLLSRCDRLRTLWCAKGSQSPKLDLNVWPKNHHFTTTPRPQIT
jgi:nucleoid DNA-binding protein